MLAYGYTWDSEQERPALLREASLVCTREELDSLIAMLQDLRDEEGLTEGDHQHVRDWSRSWNREHSDFIMFVSDQPWTKENHP